MTTTQRIATAAAFVASGAACFAVGRASAPRPACPPCEAAAKCTERREESAAATLQAVSTKAAECAPTVRTVVRYVTAPAGPTLEVDCAAAAPARVEDVSERREVTETQRREERTAEATARVQLVPVPVERPRLGLGASVGLNFGVENMPKIFGVDGAVRVAGPWWLTARVDSSKAAALGLRVEW